MTAAAATAQDRPRSFRGGVHPDDHKRATEALAVERMPFVDRYVMPLSQHIGAPARAMVAVGDRLERGQLIAEPGGFVSTSLHSPVTGRVEAIELRLHPNGKMMPAIVIETDVFDSQRLPRAEPVDVAGLSADEMVALVQRSGLVGLGGAAFPSHVKFKVSDDKRVQAVVINGCECEPFLTCDHRLMLERPEGVVRGTQLIMRQVRCERGYIGVELNKHDAIEALRAVAPPEIEVVPLQVKYPQGAEKLLIDAIFEREVPAGGLPLDIEMLVNSVGTTLALSDWLDRGVPLIERVVTVTGPAVARPRNLVVPLGTPLSAVLEHCGGLLPDAHQVVLGGPMMGMAQKSLDVPMLKGSSGVLCLNRGAAAPQHEHPCIRCGRCAEACPMFLNPTRLAQLARFEHVEDLEANALLNCFECASCSFVCPSHIPLVQWIRVGKAMLRSSKASS